MNPSLFFTSKHGVRTLVASSLLLAAYVFGVSRYGWTHVDDGFIFGYVWRITNGEVPYVDFIYVRPPGSIYLHSLWTWMVPENWVYFTGRAVYALEILVASMAAAWSFSKAPEAPSLFKMRWPLFGAFAFIVSASTMNPFPWHTVDGIFFASMGTALVLSTQPQQSSSVTWLKCLLGGCLLVAAMLCKQSFYPFPLILFVLLAWSKAYKKLGLTLLGCGLAASGFYLLMVSHGMWTPFKSQTTGSLSLADAFQAGVYPYVKSLVVLGLPSLVLALLFKKFSSRGIAWNPSFGAMAFIPVVVFSGVLLYSKFQHPFFVFTNLWLDQIFWCVSLAWCLMRTLKGIPPFVLIAWLALSWCSSISWGFMSPALFSFPSLVGFWIVFFSPSDSESNAFKGKIRRSCLMVASVFLLVLSIVRGVSLEDWPKHLTCSLSSVAPFYSGVVTIDSNCRKLEDLIAVVERLESKKIVFLPGFTTSYMMFGFMNPLPIDVPTVTEMGASAPKVMKAFKTNVEFALVEKDTDYIFRQKNEQSKFFVPLMAEASKNFTLVESTDFFYVYRNPDYQKK